MFGSTAGNLFGQSGGAMGAAAAVTTATTAQQSYTTPGERLDFATLKRRYDRQRTPDHRGNRYGSGALLRSTYAGSAPDEPSSRRQRSRDRSETPSIFTAHTGQTQTSPLRGNSATRAEASLLERFSKLEATSRYQHARLNVLEEKQVVHSNLLEGARPNLEGRVKQAFINAEKIYNSLHARTSESFDKASREYVRVAEHKVTTDRVDYLVEQLKLAVGKLDRLFPEAPDSQGQWKPKSPSPSTAWWETPTGSQVPIIQSQPAPTPGFGFGQPVVAGVSVQSPGVDSMGLSPTHHPVSRPQAENGRDDSRPWAGVAAPPTSWNTCAEQGRDAQQRWGQYPCQGPQQHHQQQMPQEQHQQQQMPNQGPQQHHQQQMPQAQHQQQQMPPQHMASGRPMVAAQSPWHGPIAGAFSPGCNGNGGPQVHQPMGQNQRGGKLEYMGNQEKMEKKSDSLRRFNGEPIDFRPWAQHMVDHMHRVHPSWRHALESFADPSQITSDEQLSFRVLRHQTMGPLNEDAAELAVKFEQVLVDWIPERLYNRREQLCGGPEERNNGFIMWRRLHTDNVGSGAIVTLAGIECLREYGRCTKLSDLTVHLDGWKELYEKYGRELHGAKDYVRSMFINVIPKEMKTEITKEVALENADWRELDKWCRRRVLHLLSENLADVNRRSIAKETRGRISAFTKNQDETLERLTPMEAAEHAERSDHGERLGPVPPPPQPFQEVASALKSMNDNLVNCISAINNKGPRSSSPPRGRSPGNRSRDTRSTGSRTGARTRSPSAGRNRILDWGNKCFHCGSDKHTRKECKAFETFMKDNNKGVAQKDWKIPAGYKSAIGKARDAQKAAAAKKKGTVNALMNDDTASEGDSDDDNFSQRGGSFRM